MSLAVDGEEPGPAIFFPLMILCGGIESLISIRAIISSINKMEAT